MLVAFSACFQPFSFLRPWALLACAEAAVKRRRRSMGGVVGELGGRLSFEPGRAITGRSTDYGSCSEARVNPTNYMEIRTVGSI